MALFFKNNVVLIGFMGAGKTSVGRMVAQYLNFQFVDADDRIELREGKSIPEIFKEQGELAFRDMETEYLEALVQSGIVKLVLATGGGMIERETNHRLLKKLGTVVYLDADLATVLQRVPNDPHRPLLNNPSIVQERYTRRLPLYRKAAQVTIDTRQKSPEQVAEEIIRLL